MVNVNQETCIGCGACAATAPNVFVMDNEKAKVKEGQEGASGEAVENAKSGCPTNAIQ